MLYIHIYILDVVLMATMWMKERMSILWTASDQRVAWMGDVQKAIKDD